GDSNLSAEHAQDLKFFFSSRRRHTRFSRDWSSDVCSSDLGLVGARRDQRVQARFLAIPRIGGRPLGRLYPVRCWKKVHEVAGGKIGRASCRERRERAGHAEPKNKS